MGSASSSSAATSAINSTGGNLTVNQPNYVLYIIVGVVVLVGLMLFAGHKK